MKILIRASSNNNWELVDSAAYDNEAELQDLLTESPSLISTNDILEDSAPLIAAVKEFELPNGSVDILAFSAEGDIAIVECKLARNAEAKRKVIGQTLDYAASLWRLSYEELDGSIEKKTGKHLTDWIYSLANDENWDETSFKENAWNNLKTGNFMLLIVVDEINEQLNNIIRYLNINGSSAFTIAALEMQRYHSKHTEMLVPRIFGPAKQSPANRTSKRKKWNKRLFFETINENLSPETVEIIQDIFDWSKENAAQVEWGEGKIDGTFTFKYWDEKSNKFASVFQVRTSGAVYVNIGFLSETLPGDLVEVFKNEVFNIPSMHELKETGPYYPNTKIENAFVGNPIALQQFKQAVIRLGENIKLLS